MEYHMMLTKFKPSYPHFQAISLETFFENKEYNGFYFAGILLGKKKCQ